MRVQLGASVVVSAFLCVAVATTANAQEQSARSGDTAADTANQEQVRELLKAGAAAYRRGQLDKAYQAFRAAWDLNRHSAIAVSLAEVETRLGYYRDAAEHWTYYLDRAPSERQEERSHAEEQLAECRKHIGELHIVGDGAVAYVDGRFSGMVPATVWVDPGDHNVQVATEGRFSPEKLVRIAAGESLKVEVGLPPNTVVVPQRAPAPERARKVSSSSKARAAEPSRGAPIAVVAGGALLTGAALGMGLYFQTKANGTKDDAEALLAAARAESGTRNPCSAGVSSPAGCAVIPGRWDHYDQQRNLATGLFVASGVLAASTVAAYLLWPQTARQPPRGRVAVVPIVALGGSGVRAAISF